MRVGTLTVDPVYDGYGDQVARDILHVPGKPDAWDKCGHYVDDAGNIRLICGGYLLRAGDRMVLIDAGLGEYEDEQWHGGRFLDSLREHRRGNGQGQKKQTAHAIGTDQTILSDG